ncbi:MAG: HipA domain-containing protein [Rhizobacter sp.]|nr:HipA domain-containing protein [Rhizobacter sp.]
MYRITEAGRVERVATVNLLAGGQTVLEPESDGAQLFDGLPPAMIFSSPSGFLGRHVAQQVSKQHGLPAKLNLWSDDHRAAFLFTSEADAPGNLLFGDESLASMLAQRKARVVVAPGDKLAVYAASTHDFGHTIGGSSAGGEQPKFTCETADVGHVIVKFALAGTRTADLLVLEHLALSSLAAEGLPAAVTRLFKTDGRVMMESQRFDRVGRFGRRAVVSAGAWDDENFGHRDSWSQLAARWVRPRHLSKEHPDIIRSLPPLSDRSRNDDTHFENLSLMLDAKGRPSAVAPAYDLLPMRYAPQVSGIGDPPLTAVSPSVGSIGVSGAVWQPAYAAARRFWKCAASDKRLSPPMRALANANLAAIAEFIEPLVPDRPA